MNTPSSLQKLFSIPTGAKLLMAIEEEKKKNNAVILAHYYQTDDIQDIADFIGDSLELSRKAAATEADMIVFAGVRFMAEVAKTLNPNKIVVLPDLEAGCSLEESCQPADFAKFCSQYQDHTVISYINCSSEIKALSDIIVTSSNAVKIVQSIPKTKGIIFAPDKQLGHYVGKMSGREDMILWDGSCIVHERFSTELLLRQKLLHPEAHVIAHPECPPATLAEADFIGSTSALLKYVQERDGESFIVLTEEGIIHQMKKRSPSSIFYKLDYDKNEAECLHCSVCPYMKLNTLEKLYLCMVNKNPRIELSAEMIEKARRPLDKMMELS